MKLAPLDVIHRRTCRNCGDPIGWAVTEATGKSLQICPDDVTGDLALANEDRETARGLVPVVRYVREGTGQYRRHECGYVPPPPDDGVEAWEFELATDLPQPTRLQP